MTGSDAPNDSSSQPDGPHWPGGGAPVAKPRPSTGGLILGAGALAVAAVAAFLYCGSSDDKNSSSDQGISLAVQQPGQLPPQQRPQQQSQTPAQQSQPSAGDQILTVNMQFKQTVTRTEGVCPPPPNAPTAGQDLSPRTTTKVIINKTKRTIQIENSDGTKSDVANIDAATGLALITYQGAQDNRTSTVRVTDTRLDGESSFFPFRGRAGAERFSDCKAIMSTLAQAV
jgi:hypothetical protein